MDTHTGAAGMGPRLLSIGSTSLLNAQGPEADKCRLQLLEVLTWILEHPGRTVAQMADQLAIAESTSRSYLCHLRHWLGSDPEGKLYLPMAYSGRVRVSPLVGWDIRDALSLVGRTPSERDDESLVCALELVRGPVFADIRRGRWRWADPLRFHVTKLLAESACEVVRRARRRDDVRMALWAALKGTMVCPWHKGLQAAFERLSLQAGPEPAFDTEEFLNHNWELWNQTSDNTW
ncbi:MAG: hypothetical protein LBI99_05635 [Propionibacteriaceae bacterium]|nr:hypothetical protein [Propionibacteriaceae bacterium]